MLLLIFFLPLFSFLNVSCFGFFLGAAGSACFSITCIFCSFLLSCYLLIQICIFKQIYILKIFPWIFIEILQIQWGFLIDTITIIMLCVVTSISTLVHIYSTEYMKNDPHLIRFLSYLSLFTFFMLVLITADNLIQMFIGWEGVGFCSFLLINFWYTRIQANKAAIKAMLVNKISDISLTLGIVLIFLTFKTVTYNSLFSLIYLFKDFYIYIFNIPINILNIICLLLLFGAMGKSAQLLLHTWLPDAMEGPTPVSALIHAATMVTAGVFLIIRCSPLFEFSDITLKIILIVGGCTAFFAGTIGLVQNDLKKVIAYSTCSQLGYMFFSCGLSNYAGALFHLSNHAFFKALLFLSAGSVIHALQDEQDMRKMGGLRRVLPLTYSFFLIGSLSLAGFPFLTGFYSKDFILETAFSTYNVMSHFSFWFGTLSAFLTAFYSIRLLYLTFLIKSNFNKYTLFLIHEPSLRMLLPLSCLAFGSIFLGYISKDLFIGLGTLFWGNSIFTKNLILIEFEFIPLSFKLLPLIFSLIGIISAYYFYTFYFKILYAFKLTFLGNYFYNFFNKKWLFDKMYNEYIVQNILIFSYFYSYKIIDKGFLEFYGPSGLIKFLYNISFNIILKYKGFVTQGLLLFFLTLFFFSLHI